MQRPSNDFGLLGSHALHGSLPPIRMCAVQPVTRKAVYKQVNSQHA